MSKKLRHMLIGLSLSPTWLRGAAWRRADSDVEGLYSGEFYVRAARLAEESGMDFVFKPDALFVNTAVLETTPGFLGPDPLTLMSLLTAHTERVGLVPTYSSTYHPPYLAARELQTLDHFSRGRVGVNVVTSLGGQENFNHLGTTTKDNAYEGASAWWECVAALSASVPSSSILAERSTGRYADVGELRELPPGPCGVRGPLTVPSFADRSWPVFHAGASEASVNFAGRYAHGVFGMSATLERARSQRLALRRAAESAGRSASAVRFLPGLSITLASTRDQARKLHEEMESPDVPAPPPHVKHWTVVGAPQDAIDEIVRWHEAGAIDGFIALPGGAWSSLELLAKHVMPGLVARGVIHDSGELIFAKQMME